MKTNLIVTAAMICLVGFISCIKKKKGCSDAEADNYCAACNDNDGSCTYTGKVVFWWDQATCDSMKVHGFTSLQVYGQVPNTATSLITGDRWETLAASDASQYWPQAPSWGAQGALSISASLGELKKYTVQYRVNSFSAIGQYPCPFSVEDCNGGAINYEGGKVIVKKLTWQ